MVLGGQLTSMENERLHNVAGFVSSKLRANISNEILDTTRPPRSRQRRT